jgi:hypothetical protein
MAYPTLSWRGLAAGMLAAVGGCQVFSPPPALPPAPARVPAPPAAPQQEPDLPGGQTPASYREYSAQPPGDGWVPPEGKGEPAHHRAKAAGVEVRRTVAELGAPVRAPLGEAVHLGRPEPPPLVVALASSSFWTHAPDYRWLVGSLRYDPARREWAVRYGEPRSDCYDGILGLLGAGPMEGFAPGQEVRVEGQLADPAPFEIKPAYQVRSLQVLRRDG